MPKQTELTKAISTVRKLIGEHEWFYYIKDQERFLGLLNHFMSNGFYATHEIDGQWIKKRNRRLQEVLDMDKTVYAESVYKDLSMFANKSIPKERFIADIVAYLHASIDGLIYDAKMREENEKKDDAHD